MQAGAGGGGAGRGESPEPGQKQGWGRGQDHSASGAPRSWRTTGGMGWGYFPHPEQLGHQQTRQVAGLHPSSPAQARMGRGLGGGLLS